MWRKRSDENAERQHAEEMADGFLIPLARGLGWYTGPVQCEIFGRAAALSGGKWNCSRVQQPDPRIPDDVIPALLATFAKACECGTPWQLVVTPDVALRLMVEPQFNLGSLLVEEPTIEDGTSIQVNIRLNDIPVVLVIESRP